VLPSIEIALPVGADLGNPCGNPENWKLGVSSGTFLILRGYTETLLLSGMSMVEATPICVIYP